MEPSSSPAWLDRSLYPFASHWLDLPDGRLHYVDHGSGPPVLLVHGTPTWSFLYREWISKFAKSHRLIAFDNLGFGLSATPAEAGYRPADHARRLAQAIDRLGLERFSLVVHDFGGPIGLSYALDHAEKIERLVIANSWMWTLADQAANRVAGRIFGSGFGRLVYTRFNFSPKLLLPSAFGDKRKLTPAIHQHYLGPFGSPAERIPLWALAREILGSSDWYESLWEKRARIADLPTLLLWGMRDPLFSSKFADRWQSLFTQATLHRLDGVGHFVPEEAGAELAPIVGAFLGASR